jgi:hypothetical protein
MRNHPPNHPPPERKEQLVAVNARLLALVTAFDSVAADPEKLEAAAEVYRDLLSSVGWMSNFDWDFDCFWLERFSRFGGLLLLCGIKSLSST